MTVQAGSDLPAAYAALVDDLAQHLHADHWGQNVSWLTQGTSTQHYWHRKARAALALPSLAAHLTHLRHPAPETGANPSTDRAEA